jgi:hypothetical protein
MSDIETFHDDVARSRMSNPDPDEPAPMTETLCESFHAEGDKITNCEMPAGHEGVHYSSHCFGGGTATRR